MHRSWRELAERLAAAGLPTLRFDYPGIGDSAGGDDDPDRVRAWLQGIHAAIRCLRSITGIGEVALVGLRLGATLAARAAAERGGVDRLVLMAPCASGGAYAREVTTMARLNGSSQPQAGGLEFAGFTLSAETLTALRGLDFATLPAIPATRVLLLNRTDVRNAAGVADQLRTLGAEVTEEPFADFATLMNSVQRGVTPDAPLDRIVAWLSANVPAGILAPRLPPPATHLKMPGAVETPVLFGPDHGLAGVLCEPVIPSGADRPTLLLLPSGAWHHIGFGRMLVLLARRLAQAGYTSLRMDISGLGDSAPRHGRRDGLLYRKNSCADTTAALDWLEERGSTRYVVLGTCAGAALALHTALAYKRVVGQVMINPGRFTLGEGFSMELAGKIESHTPGFYLAWLGSPAAWPKLVREIIRKPRRIWEIIRALARRTVRRLRPADGPQSYFRQVAARGVKTLLVYSADDVSLEELEAHFGRHGHRLKELSNVQLEFIAGADHNLTLRSAQEDFFQLLEAHLAAYKGSVSSTASGRRYSASDMRYRSIN
ncbi:MAG TPA: alpha/beta fold hydrolase [Azospirillum sp.]|nr:alpha/beta fold hydrolase [Azospirillum sp.]